VEGVKCYFCFWPPLYKRGRCLLYMKSQVEGAGDGLDNLLMSMALPVYTSLVSVDSCWKLSKNQPTVFLLHGMEKGWLA
jgi:hypothetical protein